MFFIDIVLTMTSLLDILKRKCEGGCRRDTAIITKIPRGTITTTTTTTTTTTIIIIIIIIITMTITILIIKANGSR